MGVWYGGHFTPWIHAQHDAAALLPIIQAHVADGTTMADQKGGERGKNDRSPTDTTLPNFSVCALI